MLNIKFIVCSMFGKIANEKETNTWRIFTPQVFSQFGATRLGLCKNSNQLVCGSKQPYQDRLEELNLQVWIVSRVNIFFIKPKTPVTFKTSSQNYLVYFSDNSAWNSTKKHYWHD